MQKNLNTSLYSEGIQCEVIIIKAPGLEKHNVILDYIQNEKPGMIILRTHQEAGS
jgi:hypothetical protein